MAYRATPHSGTGFSPNRLMLRREARLAQVFCPVYDSLPITDNVKKLDEILHAVYNKQRNLQAEESFCDMAIHKPFKEGDLVKVQRLKSKTNKPGKMEAKYTGPVPILKVLDFDTYVIKEADREVIEHHSRLKLARFNEQERDPQPENSLNITTTSTDEGYLPDDMPASTPLLAVAPPEGDEFSDIPEGSDTDPVNNHPIQNNPRSQRRTRGRRPRWMDDYVFEMESDPND